MIMEDEAPNEAHEHASNQAQSNARNKEQNEQHNEQQNEQQNEHQNEQQNEHQVQQDHQELEEFTAKKIPQPRSVESSSSGLKKPQVSAATSSGNHPWIRQRKEHLTFNDDDDDSDDDYVLEFN